MKAYQYLKANKLYKTLFGYDVFISYSRKDSLDYAYEIAGILRKAGYETFIDQLSCISPGKELPTVIKRAVINSTALILIGSEAAKFSAPIDEEIKLFLQHKTNNPLVPISIDGQINDSARWFDKVNGLSLVEEPLMYLQNKQPSDPVKDRILSALNFTRKNLRLRRMSLLIFFSVLAIAIAVTGFTTYKIKNANAKVSLANKKVNDALQLQVSAERKTKEAIEETGRATVASQIALKAKATADSQRVIALNQMAIAVNDKKRIEFLRNEAEKGLKVAQKAGTIESLKTNFEIDRLADVSDKAISTLQNESTAPRLDLCDTNNVTKANLSLLFLAAMADNFRNYDYTGNQKLETLGSFTYFKDKIYIRTNEWKILQFSFNNENRSWVYDSILNVEQMTFDMANAHFFSVVRGDDICYLRLYQMPDVTIIIDSVQIPSGGDWRIISSKKDELILCGNTFMNNDEWQFMHFVVRANKLQLISEWKQHLPFDFYKSNFIDSLLYFNRYNACAMKLNVYTHGLDSVSKWIINPDRIEAMDPNGRFKAFAIGNKLYYSPVFSTDSFQVGTCKDDIIGIEITDTDIFGFHNRPANGDDLSVTFSSWKIPMVVSAGIIGDQANATGKPGIYFNHADSIYFNYNPDFYMYEGKADFTSVCKVFSNNCIFMESSGAAAYFWNTEEEFEQLSELAQKDAEADLWIDFANSPDNRYKVVLYKDRWEIVDLAYKANLNLNLKCPDGLQNPQQMAFSDDGRFLYLYYYYWMYRLSMPGEVIEKIKSHR